ncbi:MurR/RpiR family transcriptional regulator [Cytobacillus oceanisediminis]|uniref:RpiR family transcriptional regulator n=2 Tax=Cytobacillus oceanisediminis TaxID=665099 RepID=A0A562JS10_9BACI|nr:MurR/RpiR family transcriptional regulator [Cytobacillus oceanisediminis]TWH85980.1 RpiR family transcriptional regulator [Cytobacillus oceanisediminis]
MKAKEKSINLRIKRGYDNMQVFLKRLSQHRERLSPLEKRVLEYLLRNPEYFTHQKLDEISRNLFVSTATISRTCQKLGFRGFQEMKYRLTKEVTQEMKNAVSPPTSLLQIHIERMKQEMDFTLQLVDEKKIKLAAGYIKQSNHVELFGVGNSFLVCKDVARKLMFAGKICYAREDWDELRSAANNLKENDLAILVSYSGETKHMLEFVQILKHNNVKLIAITGRPINSLQQEVHLSLQAYITNYYYGELDISSRFPLSIILDFIIISFLNEQTEKTLETL